MRWRYANRSDNAPLHQTVKSTFWILLVWTCAQDVCGRRSHLWHVHVLMESAGVWHVFISPKLLFHEDWLIFSLCSACLPRLSTCSSSSIMNFPTATTWEVVHDVRPRIWSLSHWDWNYWEPILAHRGKQQVIREWWLSLTHFYHPLGSVRSSGHRRGFSHPWHRCYVDHGIGWSRWQWQLLSHRLLGTGLPSAASFEDWNLTGLCSAKRHQVFPKHQ